ncbi:hypothetical protein BJX70DRAFT_167105 [Aspergillus crustosus]
MSCPLCLCTNKLHDMFVKLRNHAINARDVLQRVIEETPKGREQRVKLISSPENMPYIEDNWPVLSAGWFLLQRLRKELGLEESAEFISHKALALGGNNPDIVLRLWREYAVQAVDFSLGPARAVVNHLEESVRQWNSRVPFAPTKNLPDGEEHIKARAVTSAVHSKSKSFFLEKGNFLETDLTSVPLTLLRGPAHAVENTAEADR